VDASTEGMHACKLFEGPQADTDAVLKFFADATSLTCVLQDINLYYMTEYI